jgi:Uma2 family endonuclease
VMSDSTRDYDRNEKFEKYRLLPSLQEYVLIEQDKPRVELFRKRTNWAVEKYAPPEEILLESVQLSFPISAFY